MARAGTRAVLLRLTLAVMAVVCHANPDVLFSEDFSEGWESRWKYSSTPKYNGIFQSVKPDGWPDTGIMMREKSKYYGMAALLKKPVDPSEGVVVQYEVKFSEGQTCGGAYLKLLTHTDGFSPEQLDNDSPYTIMFGPDKCGSPYGKVHVILRHKNPKNGTIEEKHLADAPGPELDIFTHVYTLVLNGDNTFEVLIDGEQKAHGSLFDKFTPPINPPKQIPDPEDKKPADWVDEAKIPDPEAKKPEDWVDEALIPDETAVKPAGWLDDEPSTIDDPEAEKPTDWDDDEDGDWKPPQITNPKCKVGCGKWLRPHIQNPAYKGLWKPPMIDNPTYKGEWKQKVIDNPDFYEDKHPLASIGKIGAVAFELWTIDSGYTFDNILIATEEDVAEDWRKHWQAKKTGEKAEQKAAHKKKAASGHLLAGEAIAGWLADLVELPALASARPYLKPAVDVLQANPLYVLLLAAVPLVLLVVLFVCRLSAHDRDEDDGVQPTAARAAAARAKKTDEVQADDKEEEEEEEEDEEGEEDEGEEEAEAKPDADAGDAAQVAGTGEIEEDTTTSEPATRRRRPKA